MDFDYNEIAATIENSDVTESLLWYLQEYWEDRNEIVYNFITAFRNHVKATLENLEDDRED